MALENPVLIKNLTWQVEALSRATQKGFQIINKKVQANAKLTLQNRRALDFLWVKEQEACGYLKLEEDYSCIHIPNITADLQEQWDKMRNVPEGSKGIRDTAERNWLKKILQGLGGWSLKEWLATSLERIILVVMMIIMMGLYIGCVKKTLQTDIQQQKEKIWVLPTGGIDTKGLNNVVRAGLYFSVPAAYIHPVHDYNFAIA